MKRQRKRSGLSREYDKSACPLPVHKTGRCLAEEYLLLIEVEGEEGREKAWQRKEEGKGQVRKGSKAKSGAP